MRTTIHVCVIVAATVGLFGCDKTPTEPSPAVGQPPVPGELAAFHVSGVVSDEDGRTLAGAAVVINYVIGENFRVKWTETTTDALGRYQMDFEALPNGYRGVIGLTDIVGFGFAQVDSGAYEQDLRFVTTSSTTAIGNFRLHRRVYLAPVQIGRGAVGRRPSATVKFGPDDNVCNGDASLGWNDLCRFVRVVAPADGTLTVTATPSNGGAIPWLLVIDDPISGSNACPCGAGTATYSVKAGTESRIAINIRRGFSDQRSYAVTTSFRADEK